MFTVPEKNVRVYFACKKRNFNLSAEATIKVLNARSRVNCAILPLKNRHSRFSLKVTGGLHFWRDAKNNSRCYWRCVLSNMHKQKVFTCQPTEILLSTTVKSAMPALTCLKLHLRTKSDNYIVWRCWHIFLRKKNHLLFWRMLSANHNPAHPNLSRKRQKSFFLWHNRVDITLLDTVNQKFNYILIF